MATPGHDQEIAVPIAETVFDSLETPAAELPPLSDAIDLDALEQLVPAEATIEVTVTFSYEGLEVFVYTGESSVAETRTRWSGRTRTPRRMSTESRYAGI